MNEKYVPLYRKYRPQVLEEIVGQEHVKKALTNAINLNKVSHAYLFTGPRGTGKTSTARILAKSLNCVNGPTVTPCGKCASCLDILNSTPIDVIEIDAASNRSVNDAQNILEKIQYAPVNGKYKIYIIDEVHMLTVTAFNALLKTLEEPPENVVFILATTEVHKVLDTIKSRCQRFDFRRITTEDIAKHLKHIAELEKINIEDDAIMTIAKNSAGGMRDSLALLDQLSVLDTEKAITTEDINALLGRLSFDVLNSLSDCIINSKPNDAIEVLEQIYNSGNEPSQILLNLLDYFKNLLIVKNCKSSVVMDLTQTTESQLEVLKTQANSLETHQITFLIERTSYYINMLKTTTNQHTWLEVAMIDLANLTENTKLVDLQNRLLKLESGESSPVSVSSYKTPPLPVHKPSMKPAGVVSPQAMPPISKISENINQVAKTEVAEEKTSAKPVENTVQTSQTQQVQQTQSVQEAKSQPQQNEQPQVEPQNQEQEDDFSPVPMSSTQVQTNDLADLWRSLLENISSVATRQLLLQLAKPVEITPESVVITMKAESFIKQLNESSKRQTLVDAVDTLFGQKNSNVIIRLPQASDAEVNFNASSVKLQEKKSETPVKPQPKPENVATPQPTQQAQPVQEKQEEKMVEVTKDVFKPTDNPEMVEVVEVTEVKPASKMDVLSDQARMVKDLFDGKVVE